MIIEELDTNEIHVAAESRENVCDIDNAHDKVIEELTKKIADFDDKLMRAYADNENLRRRHEKQLEEAREYSVSSMSKDLMHIMDNLSKALEYKPENLDSYTQNFISGVEMTKNELCNLFTKYHIQEVVPNVGEKFDYNAHHAISQVEHDEYPHNTVLQLLQPGYKIKDRLIRPATVVVTKKISENIV